MKKYNITLKPFYGFMSAVALWLSLSTWNSIFWGLLHSAFGIFYVIYFAIAHNQQLMELLSNLRWF